MALRRGNAAARTQREAATEPLARRMGWVGVALCTASSLGLIALGGPPDPFISIDAFYASERWEYFQFLMATPGLLGFILMVGALLSRVFRSA